MSARPIDAAEGYRLFRRHDGSVQLGEINEYLSGLGLRPVSPRMFVHYGRLWQHGFKNYVPINRFDVAVAGDHAWSEDLRARYTEISQSFPAEIVWNAGRWPAEVDSIGVATATVVTDSPPPAGSAVVLRLTTTGITRTGQVVRADPETGRLHMAFDPYTSVPVAPVDSPYRGRLTFSLPDEATSVVAIADVLLKLDRLLGRAAHKDDALVRIARLSLSSPLEILLVGGPFLVGALHLIKTTVEIRKSWFEGTKAKYEAEGIQLDNQEKKRVARLETDQAIRKALNAERTAVEAPMLAELSSPELPLGLPQSAKREQLIGAAEAAIELPLEMGTEIDVPDSGEESAETGAAAE